MIEQSGGVERVSDFTGRSPSTVYKWTDPDQTDGPPFAVVAQITEHFGATAAVEHLALRVGGAFWLLPKADFCDALASATAQTAAAHADVMRGCAMALDPKGESGQRVSPREAAKMLPEIEEAIKATAALYGLAMAVARGEGA
ncbi:phage regulatory CII family protein [Rhodoligotrophos defluvii]|uniref:phage regulatory CII family protein n=1 Tax=Rhodoligotrophos defluvii TaxID=2561934 RepID=UPI0010C9CE7D|nr:phage regulatory CII family protein [Rhodoligotrophos defluvii]